MRSILRMGLSVVLATVFAVSTAWAVDYDDIFEFTERNVSERTIVQLIVDDGRAFELSEDELADLRAAGVSPVVIDAMLDPAVGKAWLAGETGGGATYGGGGADGYQSSLDQAYGSGYSAGVSSTALVYSFGYYYGPLSNYYYNDPFYYPFWSAGYAYSYWPSYYSYWWRPYSSCYYTYPYNYYGYSSYYCHSYYDPGYWASNGYNVQPGYGRTVWDNGPRFRGGGIVPPKGGRPAGSGSSARLVTGSAGRMRNPSGPPAIREAENGRTATDRSARVADGSSSGRSSSGRSVASPGARTPSARSSSARVIRGSSSNVSGETKASAPRSSTRSSNRSPGSDRVARSSQPRTLRESADRVVRGGRGSSASRVVRGESSSAARVFRGGRESGRLSQTPHATGRSNGRSSVATPQARSGGKPGGSSARSAPSGGGGRSAPSGGGGQHGGGGGRSAPSGGGGHSAPSGGDGSVHGGGGGGRGR